MLGKTSELSTRIIDYHIQYSEDERKVHPRGQKVLEEFFVLFLGAMPCLSGWVYQLEWEPVIFARDYKKSYKKNRKADLRDYPNDKFPVLYLDNIDDIIFLFKGAKILHERNSR